MWAGWVPNAALRFFARPYLAGTTQEEALDMVQAITSAGQAVTLDVLGEDVTRAEQVDANLKTYQSLITEVAQRFPAPEERPSVSLKPSAFSTGDFEAAFEAISPLVEVAKDSGVALTIDMEDHRWTEATLRHAVAWFEAGYDVGTVLQSRLFRTETDVRRIPAGMRVRLVIGIYPEPAELALTAKKDMKERMLVLADELLSSGARVEFATHDDLYVKRFVESVAVQAPDRCEVQLLLGVPRAAMVTAVQGGGFGVKLPVRVYVPYALCWADAYAYLRRRMQESPGVMGAVLRSAVTRNA